MRLKVLGAIALLAAWCSQAAAQQNLDAGKTAPQLFSSHCSACHKSPQGLGRGQGVGSVAGFLLQHYTSSRETAGALASYLASVPEARQPQQQAVRQRGQAATESGTASGDPRIPGGASGHGAREQRQSRPIVRRAPGEPAVVDGDPPALSFETDPRPVIETEADRARARMVTDSPGITPRATAAATSRRGETGSVPPQPPSASAPVNAPPPQPAFSDPIP